jgi:hypothetical protein
MRGRGIIKGDEVLGMKMKFEKVESITPTRILLALLLLATPSGFFKNVAELPDNEK